MEACKEVLGEEHPNTLYISKSNILQEQQGHDAEAEKLVDFTYTNPIKNSLLFLIENMYCPQ